MVNGREGKRKAGPTLAVFGIRTDVLGTWMHQHSARWRPCTVGCARSATHSRSDRGADTGYMPQVGHCFHRHSLARPPPPPPPAAPQPQPQSEEAEAPHPRPPTPHPTPRRAATSPVRGLPVRLKQGPQRRRQPAAERTALLRRRRALLLSLRRRRRGRLPLGCGARRLRL